MVFLSEKKKGRSTKRGKSKPAKVVSFLNQKGGVGKTTMAFNVACALAEQGQRVLAIDMDPQANLTMMFAGDTDRPGIYQLLVNSVKQLKPLHVDSSIETILSTKGSVDFIGSGEDLSGFELTVAGITTPRQLILKNFIEKSGLGLEYDTIIIDCPPTLGLLVVNSLCASHGVMVPFRPDDFSKRGLEQLDSVLDNIEDMGVGHSPRVLAYIPNLVDVRRKQEAVDLEAICQEYNTKVLGAQIKPFYNRSTLVKAQAQRKSVYDFKSQDFVELQDQFNSLARRIEEFKL